MIWTGRERVFDLWHQTPEELATMLDLWPDALHGEHNGPPTPCCGAGAVGEIVKGEGTIYCFQCGKYVEEY